MSICLLKADDFPRSKLGIEWTYYLDICNELHVHSSLGFIGGMRGNTYIYENTACELAKGNDFEIWNHGFYHSRNKELGTTEFFGQSFDDQTSSINKCQKKIKETFGTISRIFGPPFNKWDVNTIRALREFYEIKYLFDIDYIFSKKSIPYSFTVRCDMKRAGYKFDFELAIKKSDNFIVEKIPFALQVHPGIWDDSSRINFLKFVGLVMSQGYKFGTIDEYFDAKQI